MKKIIPVLIIFFISVTALAQQPGKPDSTVVLPPPSNISPPPSMPNMSGLAKNEMSVELTLGTLTPLPDGITSNIGGSFGLGFNIQHKVKLIHDNLLFSYGLGIATYDYATNAYILYATTNISGPFAPNYSYFSKIPDSVKYSKNKLNLVWLQVPLELKWQTNKNSKGNRFNITAGGRFGLLINDHTKIKGTDQFGDTYKVKVYDIKNLNPISVLLTGKIGYGHYNLFGYYNLITLFKTNQGNVTNEFGFGIASTI